MAEQGSQEWLEERAGKWTGSKFADLFAFSKKDGKPLKAYEDLVWRVVVERITGMPTASVSAPALQWGKDVEPFAREAYEILTGNLVTESGFIAHPQYPFVGVSPDGLIGADKGLEMKCPKDPAIHLGRFLTGFPPEYTAQVQGCLWVTGRSTWDFVSYDPRMPESHRLLLITVERDDGFIQRLESAVLEAEEKAQALMEKLMNLPIGQQMVMAEAALS